MPNFWSIGPFKQKLQGDAESAPPPPQSAKSPACLGLLPILVFMRMATKTRKRAHFKYVIKSKLMPVYGFITHSASVCLMTHPSFLPHSLDLSDIARNYSQVLSTCQISDQLDHSNRNYRGTQNLPPPPQSAKSPACLGLLLILVFTRMATKTRKRAHFKYVIKSKLMPIYGFITHSASVCLMTHPSFLPHSLDLSDMARNYSRERFTCPS